MTKHRIQYKFSKKSLTTGRKIVFGDIPYFIFQAAQRSFIPIMEELFQHGASPNTRDNYGNSPLDYLIASYSRDHEFETIEYLIDRCRVFIDGKNDHGLTALHLACMNGHGKIVSYLLDKRASVNVLDARGK